MGLTKEQRINEAIDLLENSGYIVTKDYSMLVGKWVAFWQEGMSPILHGKIYGFGKNYLEVKCKNGCKRFPNVNNVIKITDSKKGCYALKGERPEPSDFQKWKYNILSKESGKALKVIAERIREENCNNN